MGAVGAFAPGGGAVMLPRMAMPQVGQRSAPGGSAVLHLAHFLPLSAVTASFMRGYSVALRPYLLTSRCTYARAMPAVRATSEMLPPQRSSSVVTYCSVKASTRRSFASL